MWGSGRGSRWLEVGGKERDETWKWRSDGDEQSTELVLVVEGWSWSTRPAWDLITGGSPLNTPRWAKLWPGRCLSSQFADKGMPGSIGGGWVCGWEGCRVEVELPESPPPPPPPPQPSQVMEPSALISLLFLLVWFRSQQQHLNVSPLSEIFLDEF